jgi:hypothetical protein
LLVRRASVNAVDCGVSYLVWGMVWSGPVKDTQGEGEEVMPAVAIGVGNCTWYKTSVTRHRRRLDSGKKHEEADTQDQRLKWRLIYAEERWLSYHQCEQNYHTYEYYQKQISGFLTAFVFFAAATTPGTHRDCFVFPPATPQSSSGQRTNAFPARLPSIAPPLCAAYTCYCYRSTATRQRNSSALPGL